MQNSADVLAGLLVLGLVGWFQAPFLFDREIVVERDALSSVLPIRAFLAEALASGSWPLWNPWPVLGKPFLPEWQTGLFYPPSLWLLQQPFSRGFNSFFVFHYAWTALGAFLLLRVLGVARPAAILGAWVWALGGPLVSLGHLLNHLMTISWLPWVLWGWARSPRLRPRLVFTSFFLTIALLAGSPEMALLIAVLLLAMSRDIRALLVLPLAALTAAAQLVPVWLYLGRTYRGVHGLDADAVLQFSTPLARLTNFTYPTAAAPENFLPTLYLGAIPVALALAGLFFAPARLQRAVVFLFLVLLVLALGSNTAILPLLYEYVPGVGLLRFPEKLLVGLHALLALGAAFGLTAILTKLPVRSRGVIATILLICVVADLAYNNRGALLALPPGEVLAPPPIARAILEESDTEENALVRYYASATGTPNPATVGEAVALDRALLYAQTGEFFGLGNVNAPGSLNLVEHERLQRSLEKLPQSEALGVLSALGTQWVTTFLPLQSNPLLREVEPRPGRARLYALTSSAPRAFVAEQVVLAQSAPAALARFLDTDSSRRPTTAVVEGSGESLSYQAPGQSRISWLDAGNDLLRLNVGVDAPALLVINDSFLPGWHAAVDGTPAGVERINGLVRGIWLTPGEHLVEMHYRPPGLPLGLALSLLGLLILCLIWFPRSYREDRPEPHPEPVQPRRMLPRGS